MEVAREVQVDILHGNDLRVPAAGGTALDAEHRAQAGLAQRHDGLLAQTAQGIGQADGGRGLALARRSGVDGGDQDQLSVLMLLVAQQVVIDLRLVIAVQFQVFGRNARLLGDLGNRLRLRCLCNLDIGFHAAPLSLRQRADRTRCNASERAEQPAATRVILLWRRALGRCASANAGA